MAPRGTQAVFLRIFSMLLVAVSASATEKNEASGMTEHQLQQRFKLFKAWQRCNASITNATKPAEGSGLYCKPVWDNVMCWPEYVPAGQMKSQPCADYIEGFNPFAKAKRMCTESGDWDMHPDDDINSTWTDFSECTRKVTLVAPIIEEHMPIISKISTVGYSISFASLTVATFIMVYFRKLHCQRNTIHINLFISFILRSVISLLRNSLLVKGFALPTDIRHADDGSIIFIQESTHWECKLLNTLWQYALGANYMWIFVEGLYLHTLIFFAVFSQSMRFFSLYIIIGWVFPLIFVIIWMMLRIFENNVLCWNTHEMNFYWVLNAPIVASISINLFFFLNIIRVLFTKIRDCNTRDPRRYRKLAKSTLVLIPLFGVYYIFFIVLSNLREPKVAVVTLYLEMTVNSFQGTVVAFLFCFLNGEVRTEIMKKWHRHWLRRQSVVSGRSSRACSTTSYFLRDRPSMSHGIPLTEGHSPPRSPNNATAVASTSVHDLGTANSLNTCGASSTQGFHKVASMPKMAANSNSPKVKAIPRVSSSPKVTFNCSDNLADSAVSPPLSSSPGSALSFKARPLSASNNNNEAGATKEEMALLLKEGDNHNFSNQNPEIKDSNGTDQYSIKTMPTAAPQKGLSLAKDSRVLKPRNGAEEGRSTLKHVSSKNGLPPLTDVKEDVSETSPMVN
ncbi:secretin receptor [Aplysia californica]|uniref:Secretin receptor n=1 Tax=Aplysia californica TaxID=6500 RepID=A0ABM0JGZ6_APLCA|nr:secretin receptor [Aplysia californica]XP_005093470.1 secretin receptor [Aplysia californica]